MRRALITLLTVPVLLLAMVAPASAAPPTGTFVSYGPGWGMMYDPNGTSDPQNQASSINVSINDTTITTYCADAFVAINTATTYTPQPLTNPNGPRAVYVAVNHASIGTPLADDNDEYAAVQIAVWAILQNTPLTPEAIDVDVIRERATALAGSTATVAIPTTVAPTVTLTTADNASDPSQVIVTATVTTPSGDDPDVVFTYNSNSQTVPAVDGVATWSTPRGAGGMVSAAVTAQVGPGVLLLPADQSQPLVTAQGFPVTEANTINIAAPTPDPTPTPTPEPTPEPTPDPVRPIDTLPKTGGETSLWLAIAGVALVGMASAGVWRVRRTR